MKLSEKLIDLAAFTAVFAVLAISVFWGTWSPDAAPVMPDNPIWHPMSYSEQFADFFRGLCSGRAFSPVMIFWDGALPQYEMQEFKYVVSLFFAGLAFAFFLRERGLSRFASSGAGLLLGFCGYWMTLFSAGHGGWFIIMPFIVLAFAFMDRVVKSGRILDGVLLGASVGWGSCHQPDLFLLFAVFLAVYGVYACCRERKFPWKGALAALALFGLIGGPGIRSAFTEALAGRDKQIAESTGSVLTGGKKSDAANVADTEKKKEADEARWIFVTNWSLPPEDTLEFFIPRIHGDTSCPMTLQLGRAAGKDVKPYTGRLGRPINAPSGNYRQHSLYVGWVTCLLALVALVAGIVGRARRADVLFFAAAAFVFWILSMGRFCEPVYRIVYALPFGDYLRAPVKWHHLTEFCLCVLAGFGLETVFRAMRARGLASWKAALLTVLIALVGAIDLVRVDRLYCAPIDLRAVRARNPAADEIVRRGKGKVCDLIEGGNGLLSWSFFARGVDLTRDLKAQDARFVWALSDQLTRSPTFADWLRQKASPVGTYALTSQGVRNAPAHQSNAVLYQLNGVPPPPPPARPPVSGVARTLGLLSLCGTGVALFLLARLFGREFLVSEGRDDLRGGAA